MKILLNTECAFFLLRLVVIEMAFSLIFRYVYHENLFQIIPKNKIRLRIEYVSGACIVGGKTLTLCKKLTVFIKFHYDMRACTVE